MSVAAHNEIGSEIDQPDVSLYCGDALKVLPSFDAESVDCYITSPPYWGQREYSGGGIGLEGEVEDYIQRLCSVMREIRRVLRPQGSLWLNIGDAYRDKSLIGIPWRVAIRLMDEQGWILRNDVIWHKVKGSPDNSSSLLKKSI